MNRPFRAHVRVVFQAVRRTFNFNEYCTNVRNGFSYLTSLFYKAITLTEPEEQTLAAKHETINSRNALSERQYLDLVEKILNEGVNRDDRTKVGTKSIFGPQMRFCLLNNKFPLLTTKKMNFTIIAKELLWMIKGQTDANILDKQNVKIWNANASRSFLDERGLPNNRVGDLGPIYGFQWRHFGAEYVDCDTDYTNKGIDQLEQIRNLLRTDPNSRRIVMSAWNPSDIDKMALPPCHCMVQFFVEGGDKLICHLYQRSGDMGLGVPYNIASYSLLTIIMAHLTNLTPKELIHTIGDAHVYNTHVEPLNTQIGRQPNNYTTLKIVNLDPNASFEDITLDNLELENYIPLPAIQMEMAV